LNESAHTPPIITLYDHLIANFGLQADASANRDFFAPLVVIKPEDGCTNIENPDELLGAIVIVKTSNNCTYFEKAWNVDLYGGIGMVVGADSEELIIMPKSSSENRNVYIPCVFVTKSVYDAAVVAINKSEPGTVFGSISIDGGGLIMYFPNMVKIVMYLIVLLPAFWIVLTLIHCCHRKIHIRRARNQRHQQQKRIPQILFSRNLLRGGKHDKNGSKRKSIIINDCCPVCLEDFEEKMKVDLLACGHGFHSECIRPWILDKSDSCPVCRDTVSDKFCDTNKWCCFCCTPSTSTMVLDDIDLSIQAADL